MTNFKLKPNRKETENKTIRFPVPLIEKIEEVITENDTTFSSFVIQACEFVLENMEQKVQRIEFVKIIMLFVI
ncbi:YlcI/YnfO family protein [Enterococcus faecalis]|uniref:YlcI/YnfO family protein n=1 Tax=Enterococcus faecalis TaxID=1351 RepID=UPI00094E4ED3|nr:YlcI/YnfO family protein [Enterococcus faecalis]EGO8195981.1 hypothetical protein [Enterococcus faecalis]EGO8505205.1 hypothetical protein [Enterococcus faecalis]EJZ8711759.1 hypothetical protein [Enterococcus faecalis]EKR9259859.1 hypothetical protein [Enterococcus faecalis]MDN3160477.1 YlcI/YnfO family protein [Enterococcus faecalis]